MKHQTLYTLSAAALLAASCAHAGMETDSPSAKESLSFKVKESLPGLQTKGSAAMPADTLVLTSEDGRTLRLVAVEEPLSLPSQGTASTKAPKVYGSAAADVQALDFAVWAYNLPTESSSATAWELDGGTDSTPVKVGYDNTKGDWRPLGGEILYNSSSRDADWKSCWFAVGPWGAYSGSDAAVSGLSVAAGSSPTLTYTVPSGKNVPKHWDLLAARSAIRDVSNVTPVPLSFCHVLTGIRFKRDAGLNISNIRIGGVYGSATLDMTRIPVDGGLTGFVHVDEGATTGNYDSDKDLWSGRATTDKTYEMDMAESDWVSDVASKDANTLMMIPQLTPAGSQITATIDGVAFTGSISGHRWLPGRLVTYRITEVLSVTYNGVTTESTGTPVVADDVITLNSYDHFIFSDAFLVTANTSCSITQTDETGTVLRQNSCGKGTNSINPHILANFITYTMPEPNFQARPFTVSSSPERKVYFSQGNLQYQAKTDTWRFADNQLDYVGDTKYDGGSTPRGTVYENGIKSDNDARASDYMGWIDTFAWGTTGHNYRKLSTDEYQPWTSSSAAANFGPESGGLSVSGESDWGVNPIKAGNTVIQGGTYRTLTFNEWSTVASRPSSYLLAELPFGKERTLTLTFSSTKNPSCSVSYRIIQPGAPFKGLILFPDGFMDENADLVSSYANKIGGSSYTTVTNWPELEAAGCVFLHRHYDKSAQSYWTSSNNGSEHAWAAPRFAQGGLHFGKCSRSDRYPVRLVRDVQ